MREAPHGAETPGKELRTDRVSEGVYGRHVRSSSRIVPLWSSFTALAAGGLVALALSGCAPAYPQAYGSAWSAVLVLVALVVAANLYRHGPPRRAAYGRAGPADRVAGERLATVHLILDPLELSPVPPPMVVVHKGRWSDRVTERPAAELAAKNRARQRV